MSSKKRVKKRQAESRPATTAVRPVRHPAPLRWLAAHARFLALAVLCLAALGAAGRWLWTYIGPSVAQSDVYRLHPHNIDITPEPRWVRADVKAEVVRDANLEQSLSLLDDDLARRIREAFEFHPWVRTARATKVYPSRVDVEIVYRRPVVMVRGEKEGDLQLVPFDAEGVRLPSDDFSAQEKLSYPRLINIPGLPIVGQESQDRRIAAGARLAELLLDSWNEMKLERIVPPSHAGRTGQAYTLVSRAGMEVVWGSPPGEEPPGEPTAADKLAFLQSYLREHGVLDARESLDLRQAPTSARTAQGSGR